MIAKEISEVKLDKSKRLLLSIAEREFFGRKAVVSRQGSKLIFRTLEEWRGWVKAVIENSGKANLRKIRRALFGTAFVEKIDKQGRIHIPFSLGGVN